MASMRDANAEDASGGESREMVALGRLKQAIASQDYLFACGGAVPIAKHPALHPEVELVPSEDTDEQEKTIDDRIESNPITIRWDTTRPGLSPKLTLPLPGTEDDVDNLLQHAHPATFGRDGEDVYDESYRKALQLDASEFCSTFNPYELGIIDQVAQLLLPSTAHSPILRGVRAELYKLNVYSGPSGKFKPHVDTPRSPRQFGSLVVCLPVKHNGGQLQVRHKGKEMTFDWSTSEPKDWIQVSWAAFYSDCEHEVLEVTSGHRVTLTYNLYAVRGAGRLAGVCPTLDAASLPLFKAIEETLKEDPFSGRGGTLGFFCSHAYAHTRTEEMDLPDALKGFDMVIWESFRALGLAPRVVPVLQTNRHAYQALLYKYEGEWPEPSTSDLQAHLDWKEKRPPRYHIGRRFPIFIDRFAELDSNQAVLDLCDEWSRRDRRRPDVGMEMEDARTIRWLTKPDSCEVQLIYTIYGNQAQSECMYSHCAILVDIPPVAESGRTSDSFCNPFCYAD